jgi:hypothetical protein
MTGSIICILHKKLGWCKWKWLKLVVHVARMQDEKHVKFWLEILKARDHSKDPCLGERIILKWVLQKWGRRLWIGIVRCSVGTGGRTLLTRRWTFVFYKRLGIYWLGEWLRKTIMFTLPMSTTCSAPVTRFNFLSVYISCGPRIANHIWTRVTKRMLNSKLAPHVSTRQKQTICF